MNSKIKIKQAVILAGGRGTRLRPLTDDLPKPMIEFNGRPFLEYLIANLREQGIKRIVLLLGYLPEKVQQYFGDGRRFGVKIDYSVTDVENDTGQRMRSAEPLLDQVFLFLYCDNYWPLRLDALTAGFNNHDVLGQLTAYSNKDGYTRPNLDFDQNGLVRLYDKSRAAPGLKAVDIGYAIFRREVISLIPEGNVSFEATVYPRLVKDRQLALYLTDHRYYSVGSHERLPLTRAFFQAGPAIILDRDGVLNQKPPKAEYVRNRAEFFWLPGAKEAIALLKQKGYKVIIVTNQAGIARGLMTEADLEKIHAAMKSDVDDAGGSVDAIYHCPHGWDENCDCRKPKPGMLFAAQRDFSLDLTKTYFIGDDERDREAGEKAGCKTLLVTEEYPLLRLVREKIL